MTIQPVSPQSSQRQVISTIETIRRLTPKARGTVTLTTSSTTTDVSNPAVAADSVILLMPTTAYAAAEHWWVSARTNGQFTITHASAATDRTFAYIIV